MWMAFSIPHWTFDITMMLPDPSSASSGQDSNSESAPGLYDYLSTHKPRGVPHLGHLELQDYIRLILFNI
jgi:hypothetical protein